MQMITVNCPACGGMYGGPLTSRFIICEYCDTRFALGPDELKALGFVDEDGDGYDDFDIPPNGGRDGGASGYNEYEDTSSEPMDVFAQNAWDELVADGSVDLDYYRSSNKILRGLEIANEADVITIHDDTLFKSGKNGFAITRDGLYCREMYGSPHFVDWTSFANGAEPEIDDSYIRQGEQSVCYLTGNDDERDTLFGLYLKLWHHARKVCL